MNRFLGIGLLGAALATATLPALAQPAPPPPQAGQPGQPGQPGRHHGPSRLFEMVDTDRDGRITETEALNALQARFAEADANRDGGLTLQEVKDFLRSQAEARRPAGSERREVPERVRQRMEQRVDAMFRAADADRDGRVTMDEARVVMLALFRSADRNNDGVLEASELRGQGPRHHRRGPGGEGGPRGGQTPAPAPAPEAPATPR
ncbi:EF-hand domain-containing protein [Pseudoroseomonas cervicalis]|uniref:EF-hand domain-containing protein n=1 Tax=Teichococcus cervicalis TaxID=204525 RepID=UPI00278A63FE|nr:EF-hand domain-containing protein [Pseudoroseomonas cervicalis]MDQ1079618.1 DNA-binding transcriptional MerR regulator [Pseudoroseomonas cervicalis]